MDDNLKSLQDSIFRVESMINNSLTGIYQSIEKNKNELKEIVGKNTVIARREQVHLDVSVKSYPMDILINLTIETNFGIAYSNDHYPPFNEGMIATRIESMYKELINDLYDAHDKRGGKYIGDPECKKWMEENGKTLLDKRDMRSFEEIKKDIKKK